MKPVGTISQLNIKVNLSIAVLLIILGGALIFLYSTYPQYKDTLIFSSAVVAGISALYAAYYAGQTLKVNVSMNRIHNAIEISKFTASIEFMRVRRFIEDSVDHEEMSPSDMFNKIKSDREILFSVRTVLNNMESVSIAIQKHYADEETLYLNLCSLVPRIYKMYEYYINEQRRALGTNKTYCEYEKLVNSWNSNLYLSTGTKINLDT